MIPAKPLDRAISNIKYRLGKYYVRMGLTHMPITQLLQPILVPQSSAWAILSLTVRFRGCDHIIGVLSCYRLSWTRSLKRDFCLNWKASSKFFSLLIFNSYKFRSSLIFWHLFTCWIVRSSLPVEINWTW